MPSQYDAVVVGGGHNGLVAPCYLAKAGLRVIVLEAQEFLGGMAASQPFIDSAPQHLVSPGAHESVLLRQSPIVRDLQLAKSLSSWPTIPPPAEYPAYVHWHRFGGTSFGALNELRADAGPST